jgi:uridine kinase
VAVDGRGGSGKTTVARQLSKALNAEIVQTDDFSSWENPFDWWPLLIDRVFKPIQMGAQTIHYCRKTGWDSSLKEPTTVQLVTPIMVVEGVSSSRKEFQPYISLSIFIDAPKDICLARGIERDRLQSKRSEAELTRLWSNWSSAEDAHLQRDNPKERADIVLDGTQPFIDQLV